MIESAKRTHFLEVMTFSPMQVLCPALFRFFCVGLRPEKNQKTQLFFVVGRIQITLSSNHMVMRKHIMAAGGERVFDDDDE